jgi:hypothetical protein
MARRRSSSSVTDLLQGIADDIKDFLDDEVVDRGRDTERDLRRAGRNWTDSDDRDGRRSSSSDDQLDDLRDAIRALTAKVDELGGSSTKK